MRILKLYSNIDTFKTIEFNKRGLSIIVGKKENTEQKGGKRTFNSVGKSLSIALIHFCLGSNSRYDFSEKLPGWIFYLDFEIEDTVYTAYRSTEDQKHVTLNGEKMSLSKFRDFLEAKTLIKDEKVKYLTFRAALNRFIRPKKGSYVSCLDFEPKEQPNPRLLVNSFLLGLDYKRIIKKIQLKEDLEKVVISQTNIQKDKIFKSFFTDGNDPNIAILELNDKLSRLEGKLKEFKVAHDYDFIKREADLLSYERNEINNEIQSHHDALANIEKSLAINPDIPFEKVKSFFEQAKIELGDELLTRITDVEAFHNKIISNRLIRLNEEKTRIKEEYNRLESKRKHIANQLDEKLAYLNEHGALEEYTALNRQVSNIKVKLSKLRSMKELLEKYSLERNRLKKEFLDENQDATKYLKDIQEILDKNLEVFRSYSKEFYENKAGGISVKNNEGENKSRFDISVKIQDDAGDGVNEVKIFCFDLTLLTLGYNHKFKFLYHDSRLLGDMDSRQKAILFKVANRVAKDMNFQYIISTNQDMLDSVKNELSEGEFSEIFTPDAVVLELTDRSVESKLLGVHVDLNYDKD